MIIICTSVKMAIYILWIYTGSVLQCSGWSARAFFLITEDAIVTEFMNENMNNILPHRYNHFNKAGSSSERSNYMIITKLQKELVIMGNNSQNILPRF